MIRFVRLYRLFTFALVLVASVAGAQAGLYAPAAPENTAFVRVAAVRSPLIERLAIGPVSFPPLALGEVSPYRIVPVEGYVLGGRGGTFFTPEAGAFYTIVPVGRRDHRIINDSTHRDRARAQLNLYNMTEQPAGLLALEPEGEIFSALPPGERADRPLNAVPVIVQATYSGSRSGERHNISLERGASYSVFLFYRSPGVPDSRVITASVVAE
jgi:hypothetical protein